MSLDDHTQGKIDAVRASIELSGLPSEMKEYYHDYLTRAANCANGSANKIDDMSKVLLSVVLGLTMRELKAPEELRNIIREELAKAIGELKPCGGTQPAKDVDAGKDSDVDITFKMRLSKFGQQLKNNAAVLIVVGILLALDKIDKIEKLLNIFK